MENSDRDKNGRFLKGHAGRKPVTKKYKKLMKMLLSSEESLIQEVIDMALGGDISALRMCWLKLYGNGPIPTVELQGDSPIAVAVNLLDQVGNADATELANSAKLLETYIKVQESADFESRLAELENAKQ